ncbi:MAG: VOC family protein [Neomegalonema sp.]|nr:VOC family protein [Neomegalonema sp.]
MPLTAHQSPLWIESARLTVRDLPLMKRYYTDVLGFEALTEDEASVALGAGGTAILHLDAAPEAQLDDPRIAGLFHIAYLLPSRASLGAWLRFAAEKGVQLDGASDHGTGEALYLSDPEGNGIEIYADRAEEEWPKTPEGKIDFVTHRADIDGILGAASDWSGFPADGGIGHIHLRVGDVAAEAGRYQKLLSLDLMAEKMGGAWMGAGGYHHHLAVNVWSSRGAGARPANRTGLNEIRFSAAPDVYAEIAGADISASQVAFSDPVAGKIVVAAR